MRVFPRRTKATPVDSLVRVGMPGLFDEADEVHISVTFSWDLPEAERMEKAWSQVSSVKIGGPATGMAGGDFTPGMYLREGYVITSRGCPNRCWFCNVWRREGDVRELPVTDGWNVLDDNLLSCSDDHIRKVFSMLSRQDRAAEFTGGLEAARLLPWHVEALRDLRPKQMFFAYDTPDDLEPLRVAGKMLKDAGISAHSMRCYVLIGHPKDTFDDAKSRLTECMDAGFLPMAMLYRDKIGNTDKEWRRFQRNWARPAIIKSVYKQILSNTVGMTSVETEAARRSIWDE